MSVFQCSSVDDCFYRAERKQRVLGKESPAASPPSLQLSLQLTTLSEIGKKKRERKEQPMGLELGCDIMHLATIAGIARTHKYN